MSFSVRSEVISAPIAGSQTMKQNHHRPTVSFSSSISIINGRLGRVLIGLIATSVVVVALGFAPGQRHSAASAPRNRVQVEALTQIQALEDEKESRSPAQQKIDSQLLYAIKMHRGESIASGVPTLDVDVGADDAGMVTVDITADIDDALLGTLKEMGVKCSSVLPEYHALRAFASLDQLEAVASLSQVRFIQPKQTYRLLQRIQQKGIPTGGAPTADTSVERAVRIHAQLSGLLTNNTLPNGTASVGNVASEGDTTHRASTARGTFNLDGTGVKIGVLSDGVTSLANSQATGDLGAVTVLPGQTGSGDEGTAMLEIVHDLAPGAELFFATADPTITQFAQNIRDLRTAGCDIIVDDVGYFVESAFQDGTPGATNTNGGVVTEAVNDVVADGALYFSSAGNSGNKNDVTSTTWEGDFVSGGTLAVVPGGGLVNDFDPSAAVAQIDIITLGGGTGVPINLSWSDALGASANDYDLFVLNNAGTAVSTSSTNVQSGTQDPYEQVTTNNTTNRRVVIRQKAGAANRFLHLSLNGGRITFNTQGEMHGHAAASGCYGVAAIAAFAAFNFPPLGNFGPYPNAFSGSNSVEKFSSDGPRKIFFDGTGAAITPGDFSATGGQVLQQPVITAADGVAVTGAGSFPSPFFGTSAAAPHAAAIAALVKSASPLFTPAQIKTALTTTAIDIETAGTDRDAGFGVVMPYPALQSLAVTGKAFLEFGSATATETCCNSNGLIERGEGASLNVTLNNPGLLNATGITATLSSTTAGVDVFQNVSSYGDLVATSGNGVNATPFAFSINSFTPVDVIINFTLTVNYSGGWTPSQVINFTVPAGRQPITTVLDVTTPATNLSFPTSATGTQTNLVFPDDPASTCGSPTAFPGTLTSTTPRFDSYTLTNPGPATCATVTITADKSSVGAIQAVGYLSSFNPASVGTNYAADTGFNSIVFPGYPGVFSFNVPAAATIVIVVVELKSPANGFPSAVNSTYTLKVQGLPFTALPTAAAATIEGQISLPDGSPVSGVVMQLSGGVERTTITDSDGHYHFDNVAVANFYTVTPALVNYHFSPESNSFSLFANKTDASFSATRDTVVLGNPIDTPEYFVRQHYLDFLGREPDESGFNFWSDQIRSCGNDAACNERRTVNVSAAYFLSIEFQETGGWVDGLYRASFGRRPRFNEFMPDAAEVARGVRVGEADWAALLNANKQAFVEAWVGRSAFREGYDGLSNEGFVDTLLSHAGVNFSQAERDAFVSDLGRGASTRAGLLRRIVEDDRVRSAKRNEAFVTMQYFGYLRRDPDEAGYQFWLQKLRQFNGNFEQAEMVKAFIVSGEYRNRFR